MTLPETLQIDAAIDLIIPDNTAFTVLTTLRRLGYANLAKVGRSEHVALTIDGRANAEDVIAQLARVEVVFNPNKHRMSYAVEGAAPAASPPELEALVRDKDENNERLVALLVGTFGMKALHRLQRAVGWRLADDDGPATRERLEWACETLLANPISQAYDIRPRPLRLSVGELQGAAAKGPR